MQTLDWIVVALYFTVIGGVAWYAIGLLQADTTTEALRSGWLVEA